MSGLQIMQPQKAGHKRVLIPFWVLEIIWLWGSAILAGFGIGGYGFFRVYTLARYASSDDGEYDFRTPLAYVALSLRPLLHPLTSCRIIGAVFDAIYIACFALDVNIIHRFRMKQLTPLAFLIMSCIKMALIMVTFFFDIANPGRGWTFFYSGPLM